MDSAVSKTIVPNTKAFLRGSRDIEILRVSAQLDGDDFEMASDVARRAALAWAKNRAGSTLPDAAWRLEDFELLAGGRNSTAVRIANDTLDIWALRAEDPDANVAGRVWSTELVVGGEVGSRPHLSMRLMVSTSEPQFRIESHVPGLVLQMIDGPGLIRGSRRLSYEPSLIQNENDAQDLCDHLEDPERTLPIFVVALRSIKTASKLIDIGLLARATAGLARVVLVPEDLTWVLTKRFGKYRSVFNGGVRAYMRGFSATDDPFHHRLFLEDDLLNAVNAVSCVTILRAIAAEASISETRLGKDVLDFASVRTASRRLKSKELSEQSAPDIELLEIAQDLVESLEKQVEEKDKEIDGYVAEFEVVEGRALSAEHENRALLYQVRQLKEALAINGDAPTSEPPLPQAWAEFTDWLDQTYPDKVVLTPSARRLARSPEFDDVSLVARSITWLATVQHDRRINGGGPLRDENIENGILNAPCGGDTYRTSWKGRSYDVEWHVKNGGNARDPKRCLRIYYFWEQELQQTVIDALPAHRRTGMS